MLRLYQEAYRNHQRGLEKEPPNPFGPAGEAAFLDWLNEPMGKTQPVVTRYMLAVYNERKDVKKAFPDPTGADAGDFRDWYLRYGQRELDLPPILLPSIRANTESNGNALDAIPAAPVNVAGYFRAELGIGVAARALLTGLEAAGISFNTIPFSATANRQSYPFVTRAAETRPPDINLLCVNPDQLLVFAEQIGPELWHGRYTIGVWFWEVEDFPKHFHEAFNYVDEVWVASDFMREAFLKVSPKPVFKFKLPVLEPEVDRSLSRTDLGLPASFVFLFSFDFFSVLERKNPLGLIGAFTRAFQPNEGPVLVIKTINGEKRILEMEKLRYAARGRSDIILMDGYLSPAEHGALTALSDCYVSLHRSEGFGLTVAEAMALGKPAIATAYSGNLEFMTEENSYLCPAQRSEVGPECEPYPASSHWSEPDLETAARLLRHVYTNPAEAREKGLRAANHLRRLHDPTSSGSIIRDRLMKIRRRRAITRPAPSIAALEDRLEELEAENARLRGEL
jgi:glycosyltransferase involved in cell wall biosynthesis